MDYISAAEDYEILAGVVSDQMFTIQIQSDTVLDSFVEEAFFLMLTTSDPVVEITNSAVVFITDQTGK